MKIKTAFGEKTIVRRIGAVGEYYQEAPSRSAPHGGWWTLDPRHGFVPVPSNSMTLRAIIEAELRGSRVVTVLD